MPTLSYIPRPPLAEFMNLFWLYEGDVTPQVRERVLPTGTIELVINLSRQDSKPVVCGAYSEFFVIGAIQRSSVIGVNFKPGGAFPFLNLPASELHNLHVSLDTLWGPTAFDLRDQLLEAPTPKAKFRILEQALLAHMVQPPARHPAVAFAVKTFGNVWHTKRNGRSHTIANVTEQIGLSQTRFIQVFREEVGLTPKLYCRVQRFQEVLRLIERQQQVEWMDVALACGYFDQAHFIHDFQAFSGLSPTAYLARRGEHRNHIPLPDCDHA